MTIDAEPLYTRQLPGGGYVAIEATRDDLELGAADAQSNRPVEPGEAAASTRDGVAVSLRLSVERRVDPKRRTGHQPPVVAVVSDTDRERAVRQLVRIAENNVEVARALQRWQISR